MNAHSNEVDDLHISCDGEQVIYILLQLLTYDSTNVADVLLCLRHVY